MSTPASVPSGSKSARDNTDGVDRLSSLSDNLLHHVMSFLTMPEVVRTSLLSPRWHYLWASTPFIYIDHEDFRYGNNPGRVDEHKLGKFADHLLLLRDGTVSLDEARISLNMKSFVWIHHAIKHKARHLQIFGFPHCLVLDSTAMLPSQHLKRIRLHNVCLYDSFSKMLNHDCPLLEHLDLELCELYVRVISSSSLKVLCIIDCSIGSDLLISAMSLTHLSVIDPRCNGSAVVTRDLSSLVSASISLRAEEFHHDYKDTGVNHRLLGGLSHATMLELHAPFPQLAFERDLQACPTFSNLTRLVLGDWCMAADFYPLFRILLCSPKMKELTVKLEMEHCETCEETESDALPSRRASSIKVYPCIERIRICCKKDDLRIGALVQALLPIFIPCANIDIVGYE
uniref:Uncharacterized protein n=1 Tax=Avena sativa TaxID=4498 RepID=A0ACD5VV03_AVESA